MTEPAYVLGALYALLIGALFHLWRDGGLGRLVFFLALSLAGAGAGQWLGAWKNWIFFPVGPLNLGLVTAGSLVFLALGYWLSLVDIRRPERDEHEV